MTSNFLRHQESACQHQIRSCAFERASKTVPATTGAASLEILGDSTDDMMYNMPNGATEKEKKWGKTANAIGHVRAWGVGCPSCRTHLVVRIR